MDSNLAKDLERMDTDRDNIVPYQTIPANPSVEIYALLNNAYEYFNKELFKGELPHCLITLQRSKKACGYYDYEIFENAEGIKTDEIALNPEHFGKGTKFVMQTLVHEMAHLWQYRFGKPSRNGYHNKEWGSKMKAVGLFPSSTGAEGGKETGQNMSDYAIKDGIFEKTFMEWEKYYVSVSLFHDVMRIAIKGKNAKVKYVCGGCDTKVWGKPGLGIKCEACAMVMRSEATEDKGD